MSRKMFLTLAGIVALSIGSIALFSPTTLLVDMKYASPAGASLVMARTVGALLICFGALNFMVRTHESSQTMGGVLLANILLQIVILPIDPWAYFSGTYRSAMSFIPNTILHVLLLFGFSYYFVLNNRVLVKNEAGFELPADC